MTSHIPEYTDADCERVLARECPGDAAEEARAVLRGYGRESGHCSPLRVRMACLKLAAGDLARLQEYVRAACGDPRDVLAWGEYGHSWNAKGAADKKAARQRDWHELREWLARE